MRGIYIQPNSPYYWLRYYDKLEPNTNKKRKSLTTKIVVTPSDRARYFQSRRKPALSSGRKEKPKYQGTPELRKFLSGFKSGLNERYINFKHDIKIIKLLKLSEGLEEFKKEKSVPGSRKELKAKTIINYDLAVEHMIKACGNKKIYKYSHEDYVRLLYYFESFEVPAGKVRKKSGEWQQKFRPMSINSRSVYTRTLRSLWNFFLQKHYTAANIIEAIDEEGREPAPIPSNEMHTIIKYFQDDKVYPHHYWIIYFMLLTGCRPSSAIAQLKEDINFKRKIITIKNVKSGKRKKKEYYLFPLYNELKNLLLQMNVKEGDKGRLFDMYAIVPQNYTWPLSFWKRAMQYLYKVKLISTKYKLKQIRPTFISFLVNELKLDIYVVYKLADHADIKITDKHYIDFKLDGVRKELDEITLDDFSEIEEN